MYLPCHDLYLSEMSSQCLLKLTYFGPPWTETVVVINFMIYSLLYFYIGRSISIQIRTHVGQFSVTIDINKYLHPVSILAGTCCSRSTNGQKYSISFLSICVIEMRHSSIFGLQMQRELNFLQSLTLNIQPSCICETCFQAYLILN